MPIPTWPTRWTQPARVTEAAWRDQVCAMAHAARDWAVDHPASWALLYGSPVPGYHAPAERTVGPGTRVVGALFDAVAAGIAAGDITSTEYVVAQPSVGGFRKDTRRVRLSRRRCA